jgi:hypothetical protein
VYFKGELRHIFRKLVREKHPCDNYEDCFRLLTVPMCVLILAKHPFAVMDINFQSIVVNTASKVVIPCRPTSPDLPVMLVLNWGVSTNAEIKRSDLSYSYCRMKTALYDVGILTCLITIISKSTIFTDTIIIY